MYLAQDFPVFVMYCVYAESDSSLLVESTDSMIIVSYVDTFLSILCIVSFVHFV